MRTTITIDDHLYEKAVALAEPGIEKSELLRECVKAYVERQAARRLAALGGKAPEVESPPVKRVGFMKDKIRVPEDFDRMGEGDIADLFAEHQ